MRSNFLATAFAYTYCAMHRGIIYLSGAMRVKIIQLSRPAQLSLQQSSAISQSVGQVLESEDDGSANSPDENTELGRVEAQSSNSLPCQMLFLFTF